MSNDEHKPFIMAGIVVLVLLSAFAGCAHADGVTQPAVTDTQSAHLFYIENLIAVIAVWFAMIVGVICGFAVTRPHDRVSVG